MKRLLLCLLGFGVIASVAFAGETYSGKEMKQVAAPPPCPEWYADNEFNASLWGTYIFTANNWQDDRYFLADHVWGGGGGIFGGGQRPVNQWFRENGGFPVTGPGGLISNGGEGFDILKTVGHTESQSEGIGQVGAGIEVRLTPHIGWVSDFSWNFINGPENNFGMARTGVNFAF